MYSHPYLTAVVFLTALLVTPDLRADDTRGTAEEAQDMVAKAIAYYDEVGKDVAFAKFTDDPAPMFRDRDLYVFVEDEDGVSVAHGIDPSLIGRTSVGLKDSQGMDIGRAILDAATVDGGWANYEWLNPATGETEPKSSWVVRHDGYIFGVGIYRP
jgi:signal transduction histidine kinase